MQEALPADRRKNYRLVRTVLSRRQTVVLRPVPVAFALGLVAIAGMWLTGGERYVLTTLPWAAASSYDFIVIPMFILLGAFAASSGIINELYNAAQKALSGIPASLYVATSFASALFGAISGSTIVNAVVFTRVALPQMIRLGYNRSLAAGCIAAAGTIDALIPPSIAMALYGLLTGQSIGHLLMAGLIPGIVTLVCYTVFLIGLGIVRPDLSPRIEERYSLKERVVSLHGLAGTVVLIGVVLGSIYSGLIPPSAAGTLGAFCALVIALLRRRMNTTDFTNALRESAQVAASLFIILVAGLLFSRFLLVSGFISASTGFLSNPDISPEMVMFAIIVIYFVLGMFIDGMSMMVILVPITFPVVTHLGYDPIWFGVIVVKLVEIGAITPPVGINLLAVVSASDKQVNISDVTRGVAPFVALEIIVLAILIAYPAISLWLPSTMR